MLTTTNYGYSVVEGTDTPVNIQNDVAPNFTSIDSDLKDVSDSAVTTATHSYAGTVHSLVRNDSDRAIIRFVATADMTVGDTFTVDGVSVTGRLVNGEALKTGAFKINNCVICVLVGTVLNILAVNPVSTAASDVSYDNSMSGMTAADVQDAIDELDAELGAVETAIGTIYSATLSAGSTSVTISNAALVGAQVIDFWQDIGATPTDTIAPLTIAHDTITGTVTMTFEAQASSYVVGVRVVA